MSLFDYSLLFTSTRTPKTTCRTTAGRPLARRSLLPPTPWLAVLVGGALVGHAAQVQTLPVLETQATTARLRGMAVAGGVASWSWFQWGPVGTLTQATAPVAVGSGGGVVLVSAPLAGLQPARQYESRLVVSNAQGVVTGAVVRFATGGRLAVWGGDSFGQGTSPGNLGQVVGVAGGYDNSLAWNTAGELTVWGSGGNGQLDVPASATSVVGAGSGRYHVAALRADGTVVAWGANYYGQTNVPAGLSQVIGLGVALNHNVALKADGRVVAWGRNNFGQTAVPAGLSNVVAVAAGVCGDHTLALRADGTVAAWGLNNFQQSTVPAGLSGVVAVAAGGSHSLALKANGTVVAWGLNSSGQASVPAGLGDVLAIAAGANHNLAIKRDGTCVAWGLNGNGQTTVPPGLGNLVVAGGGRDNSLAAGGVNNAPVALAQQVIAPAGRPWGVRLGGTDLDDDPLGFHITTLPAVGALHQYDETAADHVGARIVTAGTLLSDGLGRVVFAPAAGAGVAVPYASFGFTAWDGQAGSGPATVTISLERFLSFTQKPAGVSGTGAQLRGLVAPNGQATTAWFEWGAGGVPGTPTAPQAFTGGEGMLVPVTAALSGLQPGSVYQYRLVVSNAAGVSLGRQQSLVTGVRPVGWGAAAYGQTNVPTGLNNAVAVWAGQNHVLALDTLGQMRGWGITNAANQSVPPAGLGAPRDVAVGIDHSLALDGTGRVWAWGGNQYLQLAVPAGLGTVVGVAAGEMFSVALKADGTLAAWGFAAQGQSVVPAGLNGVVAVACGAGHTLALRGDGTVVAWGANAYGQTDVPAGLDGVVAVAAGAFHSVALRTNGAVVTWGANTHEQAGVPSGLGDVQELCELGPAAFQTAVLLADGSAEAWGNTPMPLALTTNQVATLSVGIAYGLALQTPGGSAPPPSLNITTQPAPVTAECGSTATFTVQATGTPPISYQWYRQTQPGPAGTGSSLVLAGVTAAQAGSYFVIVSNSAGTRTSSVAPLTVIDTTAPTLIGFPANQTLPANAQCLASVPDLTAAVTFQDCSGTGTVTQSPVAGTLVGLGTTTVTLRVEDAGHNFTNRTSVLTVVDVTPPVIVSCAPAQTLESAADCQAQVPDLTATVVAQDCNGPLSITQTPAPGSYIGLGDTLVTLTVRDAANNPATCATTLTARDVIPPGITACTSDQTLAADAGGQAALPDLRAGVTASDCNGPVTVTQAPAAGTLLGPGATVVTFTVSDSSANNANCTATVTVVVEPFVRLAAGSTVVRAGNAGQVALRLDGSSACSSVRAWIEVDASRIGGLSVVGLAPGVTAVLLPQGGNRWHLQLAADHPQALPPGTLGYLQFTAQPDQASAFVPLVLHPDAAIAADGVPVGHFLTGSGRVAVIATDGAGLLEISRHPGVAPRLVLYGNPGDFSVVEWADRLSANTWQPVWSGTLPDNMVTNLPPFDATPPPATPAGFFRSRH